jgi:hypothetical protein
MAGYGRYSPYWQLMEAAALRRIPAIGLTDLKRRTRPKADVVLHG